MNEMNADQWIMLLALSKLDKSLELKIVYEWSLSLFFSASLLSLILTLFNFIRIILFIHTTSIKYISLGVTAHRNCVQFFQIHPIDINNNRKIRIWNEIYFFKRFVSKRCTSVAAAAKQKWEREDMRGKIIMKETNKPKHGSGRVCSCENQVKNFLLKRKFIIKTFRTCINPL